MSQPITVAATQMSCSWDLDANIADAEALVEESAGAGADVCLLQELFATPYFCIEQDEKHLALAEPREASRLLSHFASLARRHEIVLPLSWFERSGNTFFNSLTMIDADGTLLETYRKSHIPNGIGYQEKQYFTPGDTGFMTWDTRAGRLGVAICWDQWFPEAARCLALLGAEILFYPTAIGSEPGEPGIDSRGHWQRVMQGHAGANLVPVVASNRIGRETATTDGGLFIDFYGSSFICDHTGSKVAEADRGERSVITHSFDREACRTARESWGVFRDRRPDLYGRILSL